MERGRGRQTAKPESFKLYSLFCMTPPPLSADSLTIRVGARGPGMGELERANETCRGVISYIGRGGGGGRKSRWQNMIGKKLKVIST